MYNVEDFTLSDWPPEGFGFLYILTLANGKLYVGQTRGSVARRLHEHRRAVADECNTAKLANAWRVYGPPIEVRIAAVIPLKELSAAEIALIAELDTFHNGLNSTPGGDESPALVPEVREKLSAAWTDERRAALSAWNSATKTGVPQGPRSEETKAAISAAQKGVPHPPMRRARNSAAQALRYAKQHGRPFSLIEAKSLYVNEKGALTNGQNCTITQAQTEQEPTNAA